MRTFGPYLGFTSAFRNGQIILFVRTRFKHSRWEAIPRKAYHDGCAHNGDIPSPIPRWATGLCWVAGNAICPYMGFRCADCFGDVRCSMVHLHWHLDITTGKLWVLGFSTKNQRVIFPPLSSWGMCAKRRTQSNQFGVGSHLIFSL